jgi:hypothetical protein
MKRYIGSFPNVSGAGPVRELFYSNDAAGMEKAEAFARREDKPGRSVFDAVNLYRDDATSRNKDTVAALVCIHADVDLKDIAESKEQVLERISSLPYPPSTIVDSGHGFHVYYYFKEPIETESKEAEAARSLRTHLVAFLGADPQCNQDSGLMRRAGTTNTKDENNPVPCTIITGDTYAPL